MLGILLLQPLLQQLEKLLHGLVREAGRHQLFNGPLQILRGVLQPLQHLLRQLSVEGNVLEKFQEHLVEAVELHLAFHNNRPAEVIKPRQAGLVQPLLHALQQRHPLVGETSNPLTQQIKNATNMALTACSLQQLQVLILFQQHAGKGNLPLDPPRLDAAGHHGPQPVYQLRGAGLFLNPRSSRTQ